MRSASVLLLGEHVAHAAHRQDPFRVLHVAFDGGALFPLLALVANHRHRHTPAFWLLVTATGIYVLGIIVFTRQVNLPLNAVTEAWLPSQLPADWPQIRTQWNDANMTRVWLACAAFALALAALVLRASGGTAHTRPQMP